MTTPATVVNMGTQASRPTEPAPAWINFEVTAKNGKSYQIGGIPLTGTNGKGKIHGGLMSKLLTLREGVNLNDDQAVATMNKEVLSFLIEECDLRVSGVTFRTTDEEVEF